MLDTIIHAITNRRVITFYYDGYHRTVEPHAVGSSLSGNDILRCYQISGGHTKSDHDWNICLLSEIYSLVETETAFSGERPGYKRQDKGMQSIYAEL